MRPWGEPEAALTAAGLDTRLLARAEAALLADLWLPDAPRHDAHTHLGADADGHRLGADDLIADMDRCGIDDAVAFPANEPGPDGRFTAANREVTRAADRHHGRIIAFCRVDPTGEWRAPMDTAAADGARGLKLHPVAQRFRIDDRRVADCVAHATERGWPVLIHAGFGARALAAPLHDLLDRVPGARLILAHGARGDARAVTATLAHHPGVWFDTSLAALPDLVDLPPSRLLFGSDRPYGEHATALQLVALAAHVAGWTARDTAGVLGGNLRALLGAA